ncbi:MAG: hypothetical protein ABI537_02010 [Casimicrobiaceae bacterium]
MNSVTHWRAAGTFLLAAISSVPSLAAQPTPAQSSAIRQACRADYQAHCMSVSTGGSAALACLQQNAAKASAGCQDALRAVSSVPAPSQASAASSPARTAAPPDVYSTGDVREWPHVIAGPGGTATLYQPQVVAWPDRRVLNTRIAVGITPSGGTAAAFGVIEVAFLTSADLDARTVELTHARLISAHFPSLDGDRAAELQQKIKSALDSMGTKSVALDAILAGMRLQSERPPEVALRNEPPVIFVSGRAASLVVFDGDPILAPINGTRLSFAVNTNWDVFVDADTKTWYLLNNDAWLSAPDAKGPWRPAGALPPTFSALPDDANFAGVRKQIPGSVLNARDAPEIFVSTVPAEIIVTGGPPKLKPIAGTSLQYVANTDAALFRDGAGGSYYFLVSGRWFSAPSLEGPWVFATSNLPADFARIPAAGPRGFVLASVPGTPQAQEALIQAQIPRQATLSRASAKLEVLYSGTPQFVPIPGTAMFYAVNTSFDVIRVGDAYYACAQGAWFMASKPDGPWVLTANLPATIYTIPPSSPLYRVVYVQVYDATPEAITFGYTAGYSQGYVSAGVVMYGTGWYYPPYIYPGPVPIYYPYPYSYSGAAYYNSATGAWARGGAIYGPYGGAVKVGTVYNPATGAWGQGGAIYGPNGGAGAFSAYNPSTGSYAHGSAVWGPNGASGNANWYNARTGVSGSTNQNSNAYSRWGSSTVSGPNQTVHTQSQADARGATGSFSSSTGAKGAGVSGAGGNNAGVIKGAGGDVYAGADGNVYKKTSDGWSKYDNGAWNSVQKLAAGQAGATHVNQTGARTAASTGNLSGATQRAGASGFQGVGQLDQDRAARNFGAQRQREFGGGRAGGGFRR